ncbi:MAG: ATP-binding cassette domain-containing protein, partial [Hyphomicrobium sp.]|nr:ATP-binding cassette domain-containing protein [Hyphomicrobium sp.]
MQPDQALAASPLSSDAGGAGAPVAIELSDVSVTFGRGERAVPALAPTTLKVGDGEFVALVGPSGCGKSTILRLVAGLVQPSTGVVILGGREVAAKALRIGMAFQNPTMLPWLTIEQNIMQPLKIGDGEFVALVGPSGCGKSTILRLVAGLVQPSTGVVILGGREVAAKALRIGMAFQNPTMLPWLTIEQNIMLPLKIVEPYRSQFAKLKRTTFRDKANALLEEVGLKGFGSRFPWQLSGGMLQRANLCRALIHEPRMLLLDEPFGALDQFTREELWSILQELWILHRPTVLLVTHDLREAGFLASRICVMSARPGRILDDR